MQVRGQNPELMAPRVVSRGGLGRSSILNSVAGQGCGGVRLMVPRVPVPTGFRLLKECEAAVRGRSCG